jgi:hypothetical protein
MRYRTSGYQGTRKSGYQEAGYQETRKSGYQKKRWVGEALASQFKALSILQFALIFLIF